MPWAVEKPATWKTSAKIMKEQAQTRNPKMLRVNRSNHAFHQT
jgi:hypothetical protein